MILWGICKARNNKLWDNTLTTPSQVIVLSLNSLYEWTAACSNVQPQTDDTSHLTRWNCHPQNYLKCNINASTFSDLNAIGFGMVIQDSSGDFYGI